jgi:hypothetical protein
MLHHLLRVLIVTGFVASAFISGRGQGLARAMSAAGLTGTWRGESVCVGNRTTCKNEVVVYRLEPVAGRSTLITLLADKIIKGKRVPMYKLDFQYDETRHTLSCEFTQAHTHGTWEYKVDGDLMDGTGIVLPGKSVARRVKVKRVREDQLPAAPDRDAYGP